jgi:CRP-like cAMP-binding protein
MSATPNVTVFPSLGEFQTGSEGVRTSVHHAPELSRLDRAISDLLHGLTEEESKLLLSLGSVKHYEVGEPVIRAGEPAGQLFLILAGTLMQASDSSRKSSDTSALFLRGDVVGEVPFSSAGIRRSTMIAIEDSWLLVLSYLVLDELVHTEPRLAAKVFRNLAKVMAGRFVQHVGVTITATLPSATPLFDLKLDSPPLVPGP